MVHIKRGKERIDRPMDTTNRHNTGNTKQEKLLKLLTTKTHK